MSKNTKYYSLSKMLYSALYVFSLKHTKEKAAFTLETLLKQCGWDVSVSVVRAIELRAFALSNIMSFFRPDLADLPRRGPNL